MLRRKPSNASEKEPTQKKKVRSISGNSLFPSLCLHNPAPELIKVMSQRPYIESVGMGSQQQWDRDPNVTRVTKVQKRLSKF